MDITGLLITVVLFLIMFGIGLSLTIQDFKNIVLFPKAFSIGLTIQMIALPLIAFVIAYYSNLPPEFKIGLIITAACPGGTTSGFLTYMFRGNVALSVSLTSINSFMTLFSIPLIVNIAMNYFMGNNVAFSLPFLYAAKEIFIVTILPIAIGVIVKRNFFTWAVIIEKRMRYVLMILLGIVFGIMFFANENNGGAGLKYEDIFQIFGYSLTLNIACIMFGFLLSLLLKLGKQNAFTIGIEAGVHNTTLGFLVAGNMLHNQMMMKPILIYAMFSFWTALIFGYFIMNLKNKKNGQI
ncbi:MAG: hypothetical protein A2X12_03360 [Bacteroidetes bacterium GWE2_29_8]|nr:MAG: hypothetical protein A2X12_03360 [Bacteroidetes bacterium GWE2_29_8]OFY21878.1 MAG: hypothetical protein A2X02_05095 [Bacteroidetes bacterium GWF2_29_10]